jgi:hypothetical protein
MKVDPLTPEETEALDPGIRRLVTLLRAHGFETTDSGDGETKPQALFRENPDWCDRDVEAAGILTTPHVHIYVRGNMLDEADRLLRVLRAELPRAFGPRSLEFNDVTIQATYSPLDGIALLSVTGISDKDLA